MPSQKLPKPLSRREALKRIGLVSTLAFMTGPLAFGDDLAHQLQIDPNLHKKKIPWGRVLTASEKKTLAALADLIIPKTEYGPSASSLGVVDFIDEWVSAPYARQKNDSIVIRQGLSWLKKNSSKQFKCQFNDCLPDQKTFLIDEILIEGSPAHRHGFEFFRLVRELVAVGYYTTPEGWEVLGYVGNVPMTIFPGPPAAVLKKLGLS
jgi:hypothetical protein